MSNVLKMLSRGGAAAAETDPNFKQTVLLLHGDGTNGAQNNTFLDSSSNNFTITRNPATGPNAPTQGTFSPFSAEPGKWGNFFDGTTDWLSVADNAAFTLGVSDFTIECWLYSTNTGVRQFFAGQIASTGLNSSASFFLQKSSTNKLVGIVCSGSTSYTATSTNDLPLNSWTHVALVRDGNTLRQYINGVQDGTASITGITVNDSSEILAIGRAGNLAVDHWFGYISNFRQVVGTCLYLNGTTFTPPTTPLTNITNTSLLTCQSNRFVDNSTNAFAITRNGDVRVTPFSPFAPTAAYSASVNGGSGYFDGTGDYLTAPDNAVFNLTSGDWTLEAWVYPLTTSNMTILDKDGASGSTFPQYGLNIASNNIRGEVGNGTSGSGYYQAVTGSAVQVGAWNHVAFVKEGTALSVYQNGVRTATATQTGTMVANTRALHIGIVQGATTGLFNGYMSNVRITKGTARYSGTTYSIPTAPFVDSSGTSILLNYINAGIFDNTGKNNLETVGNAQIDTAVKKFGTGSMKFDGTGDYIDIPPTPDLYLSTGDFTIEGWIYTNNSSVNQQVMIRRSATTARGFVGNINASSANKLTFLFGDTSTTAVWEVTLTSTTSLTNNVWYHFAVVRSGNNFALYINGVSEATATSSVVIADDTSKLRIGADDSGGNGFNGYIDDLRITKGVARYPTEPFPTAPFPDL